MTNSNYLFNILNEISSHKKYIIKGYSNNYIIEISNNNKTIYLYGNSFPLNNNSCLKICEDKSALYTVLSSKNIPCIQHKIIKHPTYSLNNNAYDEIKDYLDSYPSGVVVKDNKGSRGKNVFLVKDKKAIKTAIDSIFSINKDIAISPYIEDANEYRLIMLDNKLQLAYKKEKPFVVGDGKRKVRELIKATYKDFNFEFELSSKELNRKPTLDEKVIVGWKNNLSFNSTPQIISDSILKTKLTRLAQKVTQTLNIRFCSVDIFETNGLLKVLEVNSIVSMDIFSKISNENYKLTRKIFDLALQKSFESLKYNT